MAAIAITWSGFVAATVAGAVFWFFRSVRVTIFAPATLIGGLFMREAESPASETVGFILYLLLGSTAIAVLYAWLMARFLGVGPGVGLLLGIVQGLLTAALLPIIGTISASVRSGSMPEPGPFGWSWGRTTPLVVLLGHTVYGGVLGAILAGFQ